MEINIDLILQNITQKTKEAVSKLQEVNILLTEILADMNHIANHSAIDSNAIIFVINYLHKFFSVINKLIAILSSLGSVRLGADIVVEVKNLGKTHL